MNKYGVFVMGTFHTHYNEDAFTINEIGSDKILIAVVDGCSMGKESHFAATLMAKILRKATKEIGFLEFIEKRSLPIEVCLERVLKTLFNQLKTIKNQLLLEQEELLATLLLGIINHQTKKAEFITIGDGLICCNGIYTEYEQGDKPDYLGYYLMDDFDNWYPQQKQRLTLSNIEDISIASDGIFTFKQFDLENYPIREENQLVDLLLVNKKWSQQHNMLHKKLIEIEHTFGVKPSDDLSIIRVLL